MSKTQFGKKIVNRWCWAVAALSACLGQPELAQGQCIEPEVIRGPTLSSLQVRTITETRICNVAYSSGTDPRRPCQEQNWFVLSSPIPGAANGIDIRFVYSRADNCREIMFAQSVLVLTIPQSFLDEHPEGFAVSSEELVAATQGIAVPELSFEGNVSFAESTGYRIDVTFTGQPPVLARSLRQLIAFVQSADGIGPWHEQILVGRLERALASVEAGNFRAAQKQLHWLIERVRVARGNTIPTAVADEIISATQTILSAFADRRQK